MTESTLFDGAKQIFESISRLGPKTNEVKNILSKLFLFSQPLYGYEKAIVECWAGLVEGQIIGATRQFGREDLEAVSTILRWVSSLEKKQITADPLTNRQTPPMFMDSQTKGEIDERIKNIEGLLKRGVISLSKEDFQDLIGFFNELGVISLSKEDFQDLIGFFNELMNKMFNSKLLQFPPNVVVKAIEESL